MNDAMLRGALEAAGYYDLPEDLSLMEDQPLALIVLSAVSEASHTGDKMTAWNSVEAEIKALRNVQDFFTKGENDK